VQQILVLQFILLYCKGYKDEWMTANIPNWSHCPVHGLSKKFVDKEARIYLCSKEQVFWRNKRVEYDPTIFPVLNIRITAMNAHLITVIKARTIRWRGSQDSNNCTKALIRMDFHLAPQSAGLWAISRMYNCEDGSREDAWDRMKMYDALYS